MFPDADRPVAIEWAAMGHSLAGYPITRRLQFADQKCGELAAELVRIASVETSVSPCEPHIHFPVRRRPDGERTQKAR
jgi:hypothetical protein